MRCAVRFIRRGSRVCSRSSNARTEELMCGLGSASRACATRGTVCGGRRVSQIQRSSNRKSRIVRIRALPSGEVTTRPSTHTVSMACSWGVVGLRSTEMHVAIPPFVCEGYLTTFTAAAFTLDPPTHVFVFQRELSTTRGARASIGVGRETARRRISRNNYPRSTRNTRASSSSGSGQCGFSFRWRRFYKRGGRTGW